MACAYPYHKRGADQETAQLIVALRSRSPVYFCARDRLRCVECGEPDRFLVEHPKLPGLENEGVRVLCGTCNYLLEGEGSKK